MVNMGRGWFAEQHLVSYAPIKLGHRFSEHDKAQVEDPRSHSKRVFLLHCC